MRKLSVAVLVLLAGAFLGSVSVSQTQAPLCCTVEALPPSPPPSIVAEVTRVVDGDTIVVRLKSVPDGFSAALLVGSIERIRYIGVQAPEPEEPYGPQATELNRLLVEDRTVYLELDEDIRDPSGRLLAYVYLDADGYFMVNLALIATPIIGTKAYPGTTRYALLFSCVDRMSLESRTCQDCLADDCDAIRCLVDLNAISYAQLLSIDGIGPVTARAIANALPLASLSELIRVPWVGPTRCCYVLTYLGCAGCCATYCKE